MIAALLPKLEDHNGWQYGDVADGAISALMDMGPRAKTAVPTLFKSVEGHQGNRCNILVVMALGSMQDPRAIPVLEGLLPKYPDSSKYIEEALEKIRKGSGDLNHSPGRSEARIGSWMSFGLAGVMMFFAGIKASLAGAFGVPTAPTKVYTQAGDRRIFVQERSQDGTLGQPYAFTLKGVNWGPSSVGMYPATNPTGYRQQMFSWSTNDIALMSKMGINIVRPYYDFGTNAAALALLDQFYQYGIKVIMPVDSPYYGQIARSNNIPGVVNTFKNHPAILGWGIGNEWDLNYYYNTFTNLQTSVAYTEKAAQIVRNLDTNHVIATFLADPHIPYRADYAGNPLPYHYAPETLFDPAT